MEPKNLSRIQQNAIVLKEAFAVIRDYKKILLLPLLSTLLCFIPLVGIFYYLFQFSYGKTYLTASEWLHLGIIYLILLIVLFICHVITAFFKTALLDCIYAYLARTQKINLRDALVHSIKTLPQLFIWTLIGSTLGIIIYLFPQYFRKKNWLQELPWVMATFLVLPLIILENQSALAAIKNSSKRMKITFKHHLPVFLKGNIILLIFRILSFLPLIIGAIYGSKNVVIAGGLISSVLIILISTLSTITQTLLLVKIYIQTRDKNTVGSNISYIGKR